MVEVLIDIGAGGAVRPSGEGALEGAKEVTVEGALGPLSCSARATCSML